MKITDLIPELQLLTGYTRNALYAYLNDEFTNITNNPAIDEIKSAEFILEELPDLSLLDAEKVLEEIIIRSLNTSFDQVVVLIKQYFKHSNVDDLQLAKLIINFIVTGEEIEFPDIKNTSTLIEQQ